MGEQVCRQSFGKQFGVKVTAGLGDRLSPGLLMTSRSLSSTLVEDGVRDGSWIPKPVLPSPDIEDTAEPGLDEDLHHVHALRYAGRAICFLPSTYSSNELIVER